MENEGSSKSIISINNNTIEDKETMEKERISEPLQIQISNIHIIRTMLQKIYTFKGIFILAFLIISIISEFIYRQPLFKLSITVEKNWQQSTNKNGFIGTYFKIVTKLGGEYGLIGSLFFLYLFSSLKTSSLYLFGVIFSLYLDNLMKLWYKSPRPYWEDSNLLAESSLCEAGFGNPSGHSFSSSFAYFAIWHTIIQTKQIRKFIIIKIILLCFIIALVISILLSRIYLGAHSINQVIYGFSLGISAYFLIYNVFDLPNIKSSTFKQLFIRMNYFLYFNIFFVICIGGLLLSYALISFKTSDYENALKTACGNHLRIYKKFQNDGLFGGLTIFCVIGCFYGQILFWYYMLKKTQNINDIEERIINVNQFLYLFKSWKTSLIFILCIIISILPLFGYILGNKIDNLAIIFIFAVSIPFFLTCFLLYGPTLILIQKLFLQENIIAQLNPINQLNYTP